MNPDRAPWLSQSRNRRLRWRSLPWACRKRAVLSPDDERPDRVFCQIASLSRILWSDTNSKYDCVVAPDLFRPCFRKVRPRSLSAQRSAAFHAEGRRSSVQAFSFFLLKSVGMRNGQLMGAPSDALMAKVTFVAYSKNTRFPVCAIHCILSKDARCVQRLTQAASWDIVCRWRHA